MNVIKEADSITDELKIKINKYVKKHFNTVEESIISGGESNIKTVLVSITRIFELAGRLIQLESMKNVLNYFKGTKFIDNLTANYNNLFSNGLLDFIVKYSYVSDSPREIKIHPHS